MGALNDAIQKLKNALKEANPAIKPLQLKEEYDFLNERESGEHSAFAKMLVFNASLRSESFKDCKRNMDDSVVSYLNCYSKNALQAAWNVATILENINVESNWSIPAVDTVSTLFNARKIGANGATNETNILASLSYLDGVENKGVPYIIDDVTYKINVAIDAFIEEMTSIPQGRHLIYLSEQLGSLSFSNMQAAAKERIAAYSKYLQSFPPVPTLGEPGMSEPLSTDEEDGDDDMFYDTEEGLDEEEEFHDALDESEDDRRVKKKIVEAFNDFAQEVLMKLRSRMDDSDIEQKTRCERVITLIYEMQKMVVEHKSLKSIHKYLEGQDKDIKKKFAENRSQTWFREWIAEPFILFKTLVNQCFKACGFQEPFINDTLKKFVKFKEQLHQLILSEGKEIPAEKNTDRPVKGQ